MEVKPAFAVAVVNESTSLRCRLSHGASFSMSNTWRIPVEAGPTGLRCMMYSPNLVADDRPNVHWEAELIVDGQPLFIGSLSERCKVQSIAAPHTSTARDVSVALRVTRVHQVAGGAGEDLAEKVTLLFGGAGLTKYTDKGHTCAKLDDVVEEAALRFPEEYLRVVERQFDGDFQAFLTAFPTYFSLITPEWAAGENEPWLCVLKENRYLPPPLLPMGSEDERYVIDVLKAMLSKGDSHIHRIVRELSGDKIFRVGMSSCFSVLMSWLSRNKDIFGWRAAPTKTGTVDVFLQPDFQETLDKKLASVDNARGFSWNFWTPESAQETSDTMRAHIKDISDRNEEFTAQKKKAVKDFHDNGGVTVKHSF